VELFIVYFLFVKYDKQVYSRKTDVKLPPNKSNMNGEKKALIEWKKSNDKTKTTIKIESTK